MALAAAGALLVVAVSVAFVLLRDDPAKQCRDARAAGDLALIDVDKATDTTCEEAVRVLRRAETALSDAGASVETLGGMRVRTENGEQCDVSFEDKRAWHVTCRRGDRVVTGTIVN